MDFELHGIHKEIDDIKKRMKSSKRDKPMWLRVQESEFEQARVTQDEEPPHVMDARVKSVSQTRRALLQAQTELKNDKANNKNKAKTVKARENFAKNVKKYFWEAYLKGTDNESKTDSSSYWNDQIDI